MDAAHQDLLHLPEKPTTPCGTAMVVGIASPTSAAEGQGRRKSQAGAGRRGCTGCGWRGAGGGLQGGPREGRPGPSRAGHSQLQQPNRRTQLSPAATLVAPGGKHFLQKDKAQCGQRGVRKKKCENVKRGLAETEASGGGGQRPSRYQGWGFPVAPGETGRSWWTCPEHPSVFLLEYTDKTTCYFGHNKRGQ